MEKWLRNSPGIIPTLISIIVSCNALAQQPQLTKLIVSEHDQELHITEIEQDNRGYLWLGTNKGIFRFDGTEQLEASLPDSLKTIPVTCLSLYENLVYAGFQDGTFVI